MESFLDMIQLGLIHVAGLTRAELANQIKYKLVSSGVVRDQWWWSILPLCLILC